MFILLLLDPHHQTLYRNYSVFLSHLDGSTPSPNMSGVLTHIFLRKNLHVIRNRAVLYILWKINILY